MAVPVLHVVVLFLRELGELNLKIVRDSLFVNCFTTFFTSSGSRALIILNLVDESVHFYLREAG